MKLPPWRQLLHLLLGVLAGVAPILSPSAVAGDVEIIRDTWGIPHVFAESDEGAFYGLGYATAEDRAFQMTYSLRIIQGRLSEGVGEVAQVNRRDTSLDQDRKMRTFGFYRAAQRVAAGLDQATLRLLEHYSRGINDYFQEHQDRLHPLFSQLGLVPERWTPADCLASWWHLGQFFATDGTRDLIAGRNAATNEEGGRASPRREAPRSPNRGADRSTPTPGLDALPPDEAPAVVKRSDLPAAWVDRVDRYARERGLTAGGSNPEGPRFSHAWVVGGKRTTTGSSVLVSDPQTPVRNPSLFYEYHVCGKTFNARGMGVPGSPILLIGFTDRVAWGVTALGADQADLFQLETDPTRPDQYRFDGEWRPMTVLREVIRVKGRDPLDWTVRETHLGPVATAFCFAQPGEGEVALKRIPICETDRETIQGALGMMRARNAQEFDQALAGWRFPSANMVFGDRDGTIGYRAVAAIPVRSRLDPTSGRQARPGHRKEQDWQEILPADLLPGVINPAAGFAYSGNHRPIESWYPIPMGAMTGAGGDTLRSWRLRERLESQERFTPEEVRAIHFDAVNPARRDLVRIGLHLRDALKRELSVDARRALDRLEPWLRAGGSSSLDQEGAALALELNTFFRIMSTELARVYGGGESGLAYFLKTMTQRLRQDPQAACSDLESDYVDRSLAAAWQSAQQKHGPEPARWSARAKEALKRQRLGYYESLDGFPALDAAQAILMPALIRTDGGTIGCQTAQSYTQWVPMHDPDQAQSLLPIGPSERPDHLSRTSTLALWEEGKLHPAPISRAAVESLAASRKKLVLPAESEASREANRGSASRGIGPGQSPQSFKLVRGQVSTVASVPALRSALEAANRAKVPATLLLANGTYVLDVPALDIQCNGLVIRSASGNRDAVIVRGPDEGPRAAVFNIFLVSANDVVIADLTLGYCRHHGIQVRGESPFDVSGLRVHNCRLVNCNEQFIKGSSSDEDPVGATDGRIESCLFEFTSGWAYQFYTGGIDIHKGVNWVVCDNVFRGIRTPAGEPGITEHAVHFWKRCAPRLQNIRVERNWIVNCDRGIGFGLGSPEGGFQGGASLIRNNMIYNDGTGPHTDVGIGLEHASDVQVDNNTVVINNYWAPVEYRFAGSSNVVFRNNLVSGPIQRRDEAPNASMTHNLERVQAAWFRELARGDLRLTTAAAPALDSGLTLEGFNDDLDGNPRPSGRGWDVGAFELQR